MRRDAEAGCNLGEGAISTKAISAVSRRVAEFAGKDKKQVRLNHDFIRFSPRSLRL